MPLLVKQELDDLDMFDRLAVVFTHFLHGNRFAVNKGGVPLRPGALTMLGLEDTINRVIAKPATVMQMQESFKADLSSAFALEEKRPAALANSACFGRNQVSIIHTLG